MFTTIKVNMPWNFLKRMDMFTSWQVHNSQMWTWFQINFKILVQDSMFTSSQVHNQKSEHALKFFEKNGYVHKLTSSQFRNVNMISNQCSQPKKVNTVWNFLSQNGYVHKLTSSQFQNVNMSMLWNFFLQSEDHLGQGPDPPSDNAQKLLLKINHPMLIPDPMAIRNSRVLG